MPSRRRGQKGRRPASLRAAAGRPRPRLGRGRVADRALIPRGEAATAGLTPPQMLELVVAAAGALTGEATVHLWLVDDERRELRIVAESGAAPGKGGQTSPP